MAREAKQNDFTVDVESVGTFTFGRRTMRDEIKIQVEFARIIDGVKPTEWLSVVADWLSTLRVMTVRAPEGWDMNDLDPLDPETYVKLREVFNALATKELSFRSGHGMGSEAGGKTEA